MKKRLFVLAAFAAALGMAEGKSPQGLSVTYKDGTSLEIHTESTAAQSPLSTSGAVMIGDSNDVHRIVVDSRGRVVFAYDIEAWSVPNAKATYAVRIKPRDPKQVDPLYVTFVPGDQFNITVLHGAEFSGSHTVRLDGKVAIATIGEVQAAGLSPDRLTAAVRERLKQYLVNPQVSVSVTAARRDYPTVAAVRDFPGVRLGEAVNVDILINPSTGEKIYDVIRPIQPAPAPSRAERIALEDEFSLQQIRVTINGKTIEEPDNSWIIGGAVRITLPGHGAVYLAQQPPTGYPFAAAGRVDHGKLSFPIGNDFVEITSKSNILKKTEFGTIWVYHNPAFKSPAGVEVMTADKVESLLPKR